MDWIKVFNGILDTIKSGMKESAYMTYQETGQMPNMDELFADELSHFLDNLGYEIEQSKKHIIRDVKHSVNALLNIDDGDEIAREMEEDGERALDEMLSREE